MSICRNAKMKMSCSANLEISCFNDAELPDFNGRQDGGKGHDPAALHIAAIFSGEH